MRTGRGMRLVGAMCALALAVGLVGPGAAAQEAGRSIEVWDLTGQTVSERAGWVDRITPSAWATSGALVDGTLANGSEVAFGDLTLVHNANDRIYSAVESDDWAGVLGGNAQDKYGNAYDDGYTAAGGWYCNGSGGESRRYLTLDHVCAGDKIVLYAGSASGDILFHFDALAEGAEQAETAGVAGKAFGKFEFVARYDGSYKLWTDPAGKAMFHRVVRLPGAAVTGTLTLPDGFDAAEWTLKFIDRQTKAETVARCDAGHTFSVCLAPGGSYLAALGGAPGWGLTADSRQLDVSEADAVAGRTGVELVVEAKSAYTYSGTLTGLAEGDDAGAVTVTMVPDAGTGAEPVVLTPEGEPLRFTGVLEPSVPYTVALAGANDYEVAAPAQVSGEGADIAQDIVLRPKETYPVTGKLVGVPPETVTQLSFVREDDGYVYPATLTGEGYTAALREGRYAAQAVAAGYRTSGHVTVERKGVDKDILFVSTADKPGVAWVADVYVGCPEQTPNFARVGDALDAVARMGVDGEAERVTVHIAPGVYREQIWVETPYVTLVNTDPAQEVLLTWYYGIGYRYYSAGPDGAGRYDPERAFDREEKHVADRWGAAVRILPGAVGFRAKDITFENSFNRYLTDEELADGVEPTGETLQLARKYSADVTAKAMTERAAALCVEADGAEFDHCAILSSQDTLYTAADAYFKHCLIEGQTDYIFGSGNVVFDGCELRWKGYSTGATGGYLTAARHEPDERGYLFRSCTVTANAAQEVVAGYFGRPWGKDAAVRFQDTRLARADLIAPEGWTEMSGNRPEAARFRESQTVCLADGEQVDVSRRAVPTVETSVTVPEQLGGWIPSCYEEEVEPVCFANAPAAASGAIRVFLAGDSTVKDYSAGGMHNAGKVEDEGSWGEWLPYYFDRGQVTVVDYAQGGRSTRSFINEGLLAAIGEEIGAGDYLLIQFGHNDASNADASHIVERYAPIGVPDAAGVYPATPGVLQPTPAELSDKGWGETCYTWDCGGTYKWYLQQYIDLARSHGATPVLMTPVSRMYYEPDGSIRPHHDESTSENKANSYCTAVRQLAREQGVLLIDTYALTERMFADAYAACGSERYGQQTMSVGESTHSNKLGGMLEAALVAGAVQELGVDLSGAVCAPSRVLGETPRGETVFVVDGSGAFEAYDMLQGYAEKAGYWQQVGQGWLDAIAAEAERLDAAAPKAPAAPPAAAGRYTVQPGDSLWRIARRLYGDGGRYRLLFEANRDIIRDPNRIYVGQELTVPEG